ncbi:MAG: hypothetical protein LBG65_08720 [Puniceicoccales bacterium]|jgi:hypothetical protein|nr:hypothetical protein [Puniceicoccales bacterium]
MAITEWQFRPLSRRCAVTDEPLKVGDHVVCLIYKPQGADIERLDMLEANLSKLEPRGIELGRWTREVKERTDEEREARVQMLATREEFFLSLYNSPEDPTGDKAVLKQLLALMLERKRILRPLGRAVGGVQRYVHSRTKEGYDVPAGEIDPARVAAVQETLELFVG